MIFKTKTFVVLLSGILFVLLAKTSLAQYPGMGAFRAQQNQQFINQQMRMQMQMQMMNMRGAVGTAQEFNFQVVMHDSTKKEITSAIYTDTVTRKRFIVWVDKRYKKSDTNRYKKIYPSETLSLTCVLIPKGNNDDNPGSYLPGKITDSCWMFKTISGPISAYSFLINNDTSPLNPSTIIGIQLNNGPILAFNGENLKAMVGQNLKALKFVSEKKYLRAIKKYNHDTEQ
jgi:hypothetical protein